MVITNLSERLLSAFQGAEEVWIAVALANEAGFDALQDMIPENTVQHFLIGINLPTTVSVLRTMQSKLKPELFEARICKPIKGVFHPKVYLVKKGGLYQAFIGSANLTEGGLWKNMEISIEIEDITDCNHLLEWFKRLYADGYPINDENISTYEQWLDDIVISQETIGNCEDIKLKKSEQPNKLFQGIDFTDRYFSKEHHLAFRKELWLDDTPRANRERKKAEKRFLELHEEIYGKFSEHGLENLYTNTRNHIVSMSYHFPDRPKQHLNAMWLSYGKSPSEIKEYHRLFSKDRFSNDEDDRQSFINHARLQVRIELEEIGIWILFGKENGGSIFDRDYFLKSMEKDTYKRRFYELVKELPHPYWISVRDDWKYVNEFSDAEMLYAFCKKDHPDYYFIIGRDYTILDVEMSIDNLPRTVLAEFARMNPIYRTMRHHI